MQDLLMLFDVLLQTKQHHSIYGRCPIWNELWPTVFHNVFQLELSPRHMVPHRSSPPISPLWCPTRALPRQSPTSPGFGPFWSYEGPGLDLVAPATGLLELNTSFFGWWVDGWYKTMFLQKNDNEQKIFWKGLVAVDGDTMNSAVPKFWSQRFAKPR